MYVKKNFGVIVVTVTFLIIGAVFSIVGGVMGALESSQRRGCSIQTTATVVEIDSRTSSNSGGMVYAPVLMYKAEDGSPYTVTPNVYSNPCKYSVGDVVEIRFDPEKPSRFYIKGGLGMYLFAYIFGGIGAVFLAVALVMIVLTVFVLKKVIRPSDKA